MVDKVFEKVLEKCPGEIDIIYLDEKSKKICIGECKLIMERYGSSDLINQIEKFKVNYVPKLNAKIKFSEKYKNYILDYFKIKGDPSKWEIYSFFIIDTEIRAKCILENHIKILTYDDL